MEIEVKRLKCTTIVCVSGSVDAFTAGQLTSALAGEISHGHTQLVADISQMDFVSSAGLRAVLAALKEARLHGGDLRLAGARPGVEKTLKMSGVMSILNAYPALDEAVASFGA